MSRQLNGIKTILASIVGDSNVSTGISVLQNHAKDCSHHLAKVPDYVIWPKTVNQVQEVARLAFKESIPLIPYGTGTGLEGGLSAEKGGICINLQKLDQVLDYNPQDFDVQVQPGVTRKSLNHYVKNDGLWFPIDPGADASLCGMCATGASGTNAVRYGTMKENTLNLQVVLSDGSMIETAGFRMRAKKTSAGYDMTRLFVGSEGTLGIITAATLKLHARPACNVAALVSFPCVQDTIQSVVEILQSSVPIARIEFLDGLSMKMCNLYSKTDYSEEPTLFLEFHGSSMTSIDEQVETVRQIVQCNKGSELKKAVQEEEKRSLWQARHDMHWAIRNYKKELDFHGTDICVPISKLPQAVDYCQKLCSSLGVQAPIMGHVGDGNLHCSIMFNTKQSKKVQDPIGFSHEKTAKMLAIHALKLGGTCTGEHGIGIGKKDLLEHQFGPSGMKVMNEIKKALDPKCILNPTKILG